MALGPATAELWLVLQPTRSDSREVVVQIAPSATVGDLADAVGAFDVGWGGDEPAGLFSRRLQVWLQRHELVHATRLSSGDTLVVGREGDTAGWEPLPRGISSST